MTSASDDIAIARRVLAIEAEALSALSAGLGDEFVRAVAVLEAASGRVIVTGMGKSGHVGRKIAATMASTGRTAFYVHPAEASHGDLGMITAADAVVALSNSGETSELGDIVAYTRRFDIPLIGITARAGSTLAAAADVALVLPAIPEACPMGLAPTTSTTMMLALGDALAVTLLERKGFTAADFQVFHPGGKLGQRLLRVSDLMHGAAQLPLVRLDTVMAEVLLVMTAKSLGCAGVVDSDGALAGIVTDGDLRRHMRSDLLGLTAGEVMTRSPKTVGPGLLAAEALRIMNTKAITSLFVVDESSRPLGVLHVHDCLRAGVA
ncbi:SIS domain-containing protein [Magnetospirillum sp. SS-4]|uniref:KpsF/GutQ family sugar-phosphate isomerase n=1 Tax=Magnetospirillum sp. SS-4 TaxID=2681465 RepID=UPI00137DDE4C|nr:KpsF/GutQ family sugar-phosphate isomerase [Magnetospirillum sp. SS-4]CAA7612593.1 D-arabinose 5-phosphate isomerase [Magnetospirillum sp. SS-4]